MSSASSWRKKEWGEVVIGWSLAETKKTRAEEAAASPFFTEQLQRLPSLVRPSGGAAAIEGDHCRTKSCVTDRTLPLSCKSCSKPSSPWLRIIIPTAPHLVTSPHRTPILLSPLFSSCSVLASVFLVAVCFSYGSSSLQSEEQRMSCCFHWSTLLGSSLLLLYVLVDAVVDVRVNVQCSSSCPSSSLR